MADEKTMIVTNKGKRTWTVKDAEGKTVRLEPMESVEMTEIEALRLINAYPFDVTQAGPAKMSSANLERAEQSIKDRMANLDKREKELDAREAKIKEKEKEAVPETEKKTSKKAEK